MSHAPHFRAESRQPVAMRVMYRSGSAFEHEGTTVDIGLGGAFVETQRLPRVGEQIVLRLTSPTAWDPLEMTCFVRWTTDGSDGRPVGFGVKFEGLSRAQASALYELLQSLDYSEKGA